MSNASDTLRSPGLISPLKARLNPDGSEKKKKKLSVKESKNEKIKIANFLALKDPPEPGSQRKRITSKLSTPRNLM